MARRTTLAQMLWERSTTSPDDVAYRHRVGGPGREAWEDVTWAETRRLVESLAAGLVDLGVEPGDRVAILSRTRIDWVLGHLAVLCAGGATVAIHPGCRPEEVARIIDGSGAVVVLAEDLDQVETLRRVRGDIRTVRRVVLFDGDHPDRRVMTFEALLSQGDEVLARDPETVTRRVQALRPDALATVLQPPGGPGGTDGTHLSHGAWVSEALAAADSQDAVRHLDTPLSEHLAHSLLATQLWCGHGIAVGGDLAGNLPA